MPPPVKAMEVPKAHGGDQGPRHALGLPGASRPGAVELAFDEGRISQRSGDLGHR